MERASEEAAEVIAVCRIENGTPVVATPAYYRLHSDDTRFMVSVAPIDDHDPATVVSGSLDMTVREFFEQLRAGESSLVRRLVGGSN